MRSSIVMESNLVEEVLMDVVSHLRCMSRYHMRTLHLDGISTAMDVFMWLRTPTNYYDGCGRNSVLK